MIGVVMGGRLLCLEEPGNVAPGVLPGVGLPVAAEEYRRRACALSSGSMRLIISSSPGGVGPTGAGVCES